MTIPASRSAPENSGPVGARPPCPVCGNSNLAEEFAAAEKGFSVLRCPACGLGVTWPPVADDAIAAYYPETYYGKENVRFNPLFERMTHFFQWRRARVIVRRAARGRVLDVGCGRGFLLDYLRRLGFEARGFEFSDTAAWHARNRLGLDVETGDFLKAPAPPESCEAIVFWHTLEHFSRPVEAVGRAARLLKKGGLLVVAVPNSESLQARWARSSWFHLDVPRHYFHFGAKSLAALLARHGLKVVQMDHFCFEQNPFGWLQSFYNRLGFGFNFLYAALKTRSARTLRLRDHVLESIMTAALLPPLLAASLALTFIEAALRRGGTIEAYAIKE